MYQINTRRYSDYMITDWWFFLNGPIKIASYMRVLRDSIFQRQPKQMTKILIPSCRNSTDIYHLNILRIITIIYQIFIDGE